ncbi:MAG: hypothetical protein K2H22_06390, partial [Muribaculaceae bacterium]|nr:hypothetical protein [Muribaculaceae bacterium]
MKKHIFSLHTVAIMATVLLLGGFASHDASAKKVTKSKTSRITTMNAPDFAYPKTVEKNATASLEKAVAHGDWPAAVESTVQLVTAENAVSHGNAVKGIGRIDSVASIAPESWKPAFMLIKADVYNSLYGSIRWHADSRKLPVDSIQENPYEWSREIFADTVFGICSA